MPPVEIYMYFLTWGYEILFPLEDCGAKKILHSYDEE